MTIRTAVLETRFLVGDKKLYDDLVTRFDKDVVQGTAAGIRHRQARRARGAPQAAPDNRAISSSPMSRTARAGCATCTRCSGSRNMSIACATRDELIAQAACSTSASIAPSSAARTSCGRSAATCTSTRARAEERLGFDIQREIAQRLGYTEHPGMQDVERFMKHYFLIAKDVGNLTAILCAQSRRRAGQACAGAEPRDGAACARATRRTRLGEADEFVVDNNRITIASPDVFRRDPVNLIRMFRLAQKHELRSASRRDARRRPLRSC